MKLNLKGRSQILNKLATNLYECCLTSTAMTEQTYLIEDTEEEGIESLARQAAYQRLSSKLVKVAFDTRKINAETERNPRSNLQHYQRSEDFVTQEDQENIERIAKLLKPLHEIKNQYGKEADYHQSYARILLDNVEKTLVLKAEQRDIFRPQVDYLNQILYLRYRLSKDDLNYMTSDQLKQAILKKDENLLKRGVAYAIKNSEPREKPLLKDGDAVQNSIVNAIFGNNDFRRDGEKTVTRTITITITDSVLD